ncbi:restriction endonuclease subunit S [Sulfitobacter sp. PS-8MA]|uniref:restriction endonuclease subunit S n=1 Tax=Sulfitobacter sp. PS-8MA TaxID=3237707 RepID=UPI0034C68C28
MNIAAYPTYKNYRDSGVQWVGHFPANWELARLGGLFDERRKKVSDADFEPLSVTKNGIFPQLETAAKTNDGENRKLVRKGDFVINSRSDRKGSSGVSPLDGSVSLINTVLKPKRILPEYCQHLLKSYAFVEEYYRVGRGIVADLWTTRYDEMRTILVALPSASEQRAIAAFLDRKCAKIDEAVRIKEKQIALLRERRQILIQQAVTRGLNPGAPMKDSGIDWIGQIPAHWEVGRNKHMFAEINQRSARGEEQHLSMSQKLGLVPANLVEKSLTSESYQGAKLVQKGDLVLNRLKAHLAVFSLAPMEGLVSPDYSVFRPFIKGVASDYFEILFKTSKYLGEFRLRVRGIVEGFYRLYTDDFMDCPLLLPPLEEQLGIVSHVRETHAKFDNAISIKEDQIATLKEYKASLINAAVTGKIKVI